MAIGTQLELCGSIFFCENLGMDRLYLEVMRTVSDVDCKRS